MCGRGEITSYPQTASSYLRSFMKYLFLFAHPDDETVACAGTIKQLVEHGDEVHIVLATDGSAGEVSEAAQQKFKELGFVGNLRRHELQQVKSLLGITTLEILDFEDGQITNQLVWGKLTTTFIKLIDLHKPDVVITFDHSGWYFHLDHVGVSIAATLAVQQAKSSPDIFLLSHFHVDGSKWKYIYYEPMPITHTVDISQYTDIKEQAFSFHASQNLAEPKRQLQSIQGQKELYQLALASEKGQQLLASHFLFKAIKSD